ncbi:MAG: hypothetical protein JRN09_08320 [Nitrososphaerota archaeon]|nr:hypothetical protein [Nitrososphaerota archaeon]
MSAERSASPDQESLARELERYEKRCSELEKQVATLASENKELREKLASLEATVSAVVARGIDAKADTTKHRYRKSGRREGARVGTRPRRPDVDQGDVRAEEGELLRLCHGILSKSTSER